MDSAAVAAAVAAVEASEAYAHDVAIPSNEVGTIASAPTEAVTTPPAEAFTAAAAAAGVHTHVGKLTGPTVKTVSGPRRKRLLRLDDGDLIVIPTNIYKQAGGVKLDITLGGFRIDGEKCTLKNRAYNFGVLPGFARENILALRAFRDMLLPMDRSMLTSINTIIAAEAITRYDEEHQKPPEMSSPAEESSYYGVGGWIPDSRVIHMTFAGSSMELKIRAGDLRAIDRPSQCKLMLEALKADPEVLAGRLEPAPPAIEVYGTGGKATVGMEPGSTGFARAPEAFPQASGTGIRYFGKSGAASAAAAGGVGGVGAGGGGGVSADFSGLFGDGEDVYDNDGYDYYFDSAPKQRRKKKRKKKTVTVTVDAGGQSADGEVGGGEGGGGGGGGATVDCDLPLYVQVVEGKQCRPSLRLKVPLSGFLVNGEEVPESELTVANGLDLTKPNILALRACRDAVLANFAGPDLVKRVVAGEVFRVWTKRRGENAWASPQRPDVAAAATSAAAMAAAAAATAVAAGAAKTEEAGTEGLAAGMDMDEQETTAVRTPAAAEHMLFNAFPTNPISSESGILAFGGDSHVDMATVAKEQQQQQQQQQMQQQEQEEAQEQQNWQEQQLQQQQQQLQQQLQQQVHPTNEPSTEELAAAGGNRILPPTEDARRAADADEGVGGNGGVAVGATHFFATPASTRAAAARSLVTAAAVAGGLAAGRPPVWATDDIFTLSSPATFPGAPRLELRMTMGELRKARQTRLAELKRLLAAMLQDPKVQAGELDVVDEMRTPAPAITTNNLSGAAAAAAAAGAAAMATRANSHSVPLLAGGGQENEHRPASRLANHDGGGILDVGSKVAEKWGATLLQRGKRARETAGGIDVNGGGWALPSLDSSGVAATAAAAAAGRGPDGISISTTPTAAASRQRRQLWALAIRENELLFEREKEAARKEYDARQQELLRWMIDEEAGRHDALGGDAGPPPPATVTGD